ncbi:unnamed protein product [Parnassius apollo]|uniref:(apollo) hypothetical protein n=1 Tax=Parnassius apollo TaxID=110799 RepID=A0A8S3WA30_PARAO|nr:unnamed protein product [Parnassius apollo]
MTKWKLSRQTFGCEEMNFSEGDEVTIGRGLNNTVTLSSIVISRNHCVIHFKHNKAMITDLKSSNGVYVGLKRIPPNIPYTLQDSDTIGFGWTIGAPLVNISDSEKYIFKLTKENCLPPVSKRLLFQNDLENIDNTVATLNGISDTNTEIKRNLSPIFDTKLNLKRKLTDNVSKLKVPDEVISILSDSDIETCTNKETIAKKIKLENQQVKEEPIKSENDDLQYEAFSIKQEYLGYDDEPIQIDSDSDSESEHWFLRLSQSSPGKPFTKIVQPKPSDVKQDDNSYSQAEDFMVLDLKKENDETDEEFTDDLITIPPYPPTLNKNVKKLSDDKSTEKCSTFEKPGSIIITDDESKELQLECSDVNHDEVDGENLKTILTKDVHDSTAQISLASIKEIPKKIQVIEPLVQPSKKKETPLMQESKTTSNKHKKKKSKSKKRITNSQKEERKKKLKEIASKEKEDIEPEGESTLSVNNSIKPVVNAKVTTLNRGAFLTDLVQATVKPTKRKGSLNKTKDADTSQTDENISEIGKDGNKSKRKEYSKHASKKHETSKTKNKNETSKSSKSFKTFESDSRIPLKSVKPLKESDKSGKPFSIVEPLPTKSACKKTIKKVRFTDEEPKVHLFEIEPGNKMKKTSSIKTSLLDVRHMPVFSLEKITLMKILRWNPHWLDEQLHNNDPPPILGHDNPPMAIFHFFSNHKQYIQLVGDLLLMEIWECLTQGYLRLNSQGFQMRIDSLPPVPPQERCFDLFNLSVNISLPTSEIKSVPRVGEVLLVTFGPENAKNKRFFFVHNVRCLPSPPNNIHSFFTISLYATFTEKMGLLRPGEMMLGKSLAYINKELMLFEAMEHLAGSPLSEAILKPQPYHFVKPNVPNIEHDLKSQWTVTLNASQKLAVCSSVSAALGDKPCIQMVQGPPGTGKSSVICAIVMTYFYNSAGKKQQNRGKILICATSNAAVDELVIRLLNIRQSLPKAERFRMVRVGRAEAMHPRARDVSSQQLAQRDAARAHVDPAHSRPGLAEEISHLEAKINMWKTQAQDARDPVRVAYCQSRIDGLVKRIALLRGGGGGSAGGEEVRPEQVAQAERRIIEGADIVVTTLASAHNHKMKGLKRRIALCIVDEAGQAIEPETLIPLTLDVTRLTLIGDPQQLPGFICSQRAKKHGLGESLFSRLASCTEHWNDGSPVILLNQQYRMQKEIVDYPNRAFYGGKVHTIAPPRVELNIPPYTIISISSGDKGQGSSGGNEMEAWGVARLAAALAATLRTRGLSLAVITPYTAQRDLVRRNLRMLSDTSQGQVEVNTVDSFQGQERDVVVVSLARSYGVGFLTDAGRMNVMLTRARHALLICLNPLAITKNQQWRTLVEDAHRRNVYRTLPNKICHSTSTTPIPHEEILKHVVHGKTNK